MKKHNRLRGAAALAAATAMTLTSLLGGLPQAHAAALTMVTGPTIGYVDADGNPAADSQGTAIAAPQLGFVLMADPGTWTAADGSQVTFTYNWTVGASPKKCTDKAAIVAGGSRTARDFVPVYSMIGSYVCVTVMAHSGSDAKSAPLVATPSAVVGFNPALTALPKSFADITTALSANPYTSKAWLTAYGWPDNSPAGPDMGTSWTNSTYPDIKGKWNVYGRGIHESANGDGSYANPLTLAAVVNSTDADVPVPSLIPWGTEIYVPRIQKYFITEDICYECTGDYGGEGTVKDSDGTSKVLGAGGDGGPGFIHFDMWVGGQNDVFADVMACENQITISDPETIIVNPSPDMAVSDGTIYHVDASGNKICNGEPLEPAAGGQVGQVRSVDPDTAYPGAGYSTVAQWDKSFGMADAAGQNFANKDLKWPIWDGTKLASTTIVRPGMKNVGVHPDGTLCITDPGNSAEAGTWLTLEPCLDAKNAQSADLASQMVSYSGSFLIFNNMCFDISRDGKGNPDIGSIDWNDQDYSDLSSESVSPGIWPVTLHKCNNGTSDQWQMNGDGSITDMQTGYWTLGNMGKGADGVTHLWAIPMEMVDEAAYANSFWDHPGTRGDNDTAPVAVTAPDGVAAGGTITVTVAGLTTPTFQLLLTPSGNTTGGIVLQDSVSVPTQASGASSGTWTGDVTLPADLAAGTYQVTAVGLTDTVPKMETTGGTTAIDSESDLQTVPDPVDGVARWRLVNFANPPVALTIATQGTSSDLTVAGTATAPASTGGNHTTAIIWICVGVVLVVAGLVIWLVRRRKAPASTDADANKDS